MLNTAYNTNKHCLISSIYLNIFTKIDDDDALHFKKIAFDQNVQNSKNTIATFLYWLHVKTYTCETARVVPLVSTPTCQ